MTPALIALLVVWGLAASSTASAATCPKQTYLDFDHLAYAAVNIPTTVRLTPGSQLGGGTVDQPTSTNGCRREQLSVDVVKAGPIDPRVAVLVAGRPGTVFVIGARCAGFAGPSYWGCLLRPLSFDGQQFTASSYPAQPAPRKTVPLGAALGVADYQGHRVTVRRIRGVDPLLAVGISEMPSAAFLSPRTCPYPEFSNIPEYDTLLRCMRSPVWFTFDPPGTDVGGTVVARTDRALSAAVAGATISLVALPVAADLVPPHHGPLLQVGHVADEVKLKVPTVSPGLYEAVVSCPACAARSGGGAALYPAGSILVTAKPKSSLVVGIISYVLAILLLMAVILTFRTRGSRRALGSAITSLLMGESRRGGSSRR